MIETKGNPTLAIIGIDQQDFDKNQLVSGAYPYQKGLQQRLPGKTVEQLAPGPVGSIYVFYQVFGRHYILTDFGGSTGIVEVPPDPITLPALPPASNAWIDTFSGYTLGTVARLWGAGIWNNSVGICETIIQGIIDPFLVFETLPPGAQTPDTQFQPVPVPGSPTPSAPADPGSAAFLYPPGTPQPDVILHNPQWDADNTCTGGGFLRSGSPDKVDYAVYPGQTVTDSIFAFSVPIGKLTPWHNVILGHDADVYVGIVKGTCTAGRPDPPTASIYITYQDGSIGLEG